MFAPDCLYFSIDSGSVGQMAHAPAILRVELVTKEIAEDRKGKILDIAGEIKHKRSQCRE